MERLKNENPHRDLAKMRKGFRKFTLSGKKSDRGRMKRVLERGLALLNFLVGLNHLIWKVFRGNVNSVKILGWLDPRFTIRAK